MASHLSLTFELKISEPRLIHGNRFEAQLTAVKDRLEAAKVGSTRGLAATNGANGPGGFNLGGGSRIAKPLRGGGDVNGGGQLQAQEPGSKRASWFFNQKTWPAGGSWT